MIVVRLFGCEVLAVGSPELDEANVEMCDSTAGSFEPADPLDRDDAVFPRSLRARPGTVRVGSSHTSSTRQRAPFGFTSRS